MKVTRLSLRSPYVQIGGHDKIANGGNTAQRVGSFTLAWIARALLWLQLFHLFGSSPLLLQAADSPSTSMLRTPAASASTPAQVPTPPASGIATTPGPKAIPTQNFGPYTIRPEKLAKILKYGGPLHMFDQTPSIIQKLGPNKVVWARIFGAPGNTFGPTVVTLGRGGALMDDALIKQLEGAITQQEKTNPGLYATVQKFELANGALGYVFLLGSGEDARGVGGGVTSPDGQFDLTISMLFPIKPPIVETATNKQYIDRLSNGNPAAMISLGRSVLAALYTTAARDFQIYTNGSGSPTQ